MKRDDNRPNEAAPVNPATAKTGKGLSESQRDRFEDMLRNLLPDRNPIAETMVRFVIQSPYCATRLKDTACITDLGKLNSTRFLRVRGFKTIVVNDPASFNNVALFIRDQVTLKQSTSFYFYQD